MKLWLPREQALAHITQKQGEHEARRIRDFHKRLRALDPRLDCFLQTRDVDTEDITLRKGFWHILRHNEDGTLSVWEVSNPDGSFREPDEAIIDALRKIDANRTNLTHEHRRHKQRELSRKEKEQQRKREARQAKLQDEVDYRFRVSIAPHGPGAKVGDVRRIRRGGGLVIEK